MNPTYCAECDHVVAETRKRHPAHWLCVKFPRLEGKGFVSPGFWATEEPFMRCHQINGGQCPVFEPLRINPKLEQLPVKDDRQ